VVTVERRTLVRPTGERGLRDSALVLTMASGMLAGAPTLYDRYAGAMYGLARCMLADDNAAEASVTDAFAQAFRDAGLFPASGLTVESWLLGLVRNDVIRRIRERCGRLP
jgi:RNA polymerase sigma-70 factor, ECF subfamily